MTPGIRHHVLHTTHNHGRRKPLRVSWRRRLFNAASWVALVLAFVFFVLATGGRHV